MLSTSVQFIKTGEAFYFPVSSYEASTYNKYLFQIGVYDQLVSQFGLECELRLLFQIVSQNGKEEVIPYVLPDIKEDVKKMLDHFDYNRVRNKQVKIGLW